MPGDKLSALIADRVQVVRAGDAAPSNIVLPTGRCCAFVAPHCLMVAE